MLLLRRGYSRRVEKYQVTPMFCKARRSLRCMWLNRWTGWGVCQCVCVCVCEGLCGVCTCRRTGVSKTWLRPLTLFISVTPGPALHFTNSIGWLNVNTRTQSCQEHNKRQRKTNTAPILRQFTQITREIRYSWSSFCRFFLKSVKFLPPKKWGWCECCKLHLTKKKNRDSFISNTIWHGFEMGVLIHRLVHC